MTTQFNKKEPIPGYTISELIGRGGYGEVWRAIAPGGLAKAIKIVYGDVDASRAATELRALSRVKDVRHPLLLSIERIELVAGNLVIVTELADCNLKEHFLRYRAANAVGVPQEELLGYLGDAADALDFIYTNYSLQHLDVKPENFLLIGKRAKVGDYGLVKNLYERSASVVGGMTPTYSPPELFEGKPNRNSDQYSLAIVYTQMLTGTLPFQASNTAQLAEQHLRGIPDLSNLPKHQRPVIARALSKDPACRFESCQAMVAALRTSPMELPTAPTPQPAPIAAQPVQCVTIDSSEPQFEKTCRIQAVSGNQSVASRETNPAVEGRPTVFVGAGGMAVEALAKLAGRLRDRIGDEGDWPGIRMLVLDTDARTLGNRFGETSDKIQLVPIRLQSTEAFGSRASDVLNWLSRRWFYNIPRDLTTGGYRPLGRLALITHAKQVRGAISEVISAAAGKRPTVPGGDGRSSPTAAQTPRVIVVGSICGGAGGGSLIDLAYAVRGELKRQGLPDDDVHGVLLHSTPRANADRDKTVANAYATLKELIHFSRAGSHFPGEYSLGAPPFHGDNATFGRTHVLSLGNGLDERERDLATDTVAEFLYCSTFAPSGQILDDKRSAASAVAESVARRSVSSYNVLALGASINQVVARVSRRTCVDVVRLWREGQRAAGKESVGTQDPTALINAVAARMAPRSAQVDAAMKQKLVDCNLAAGGLQQEATEVLAMEAGGDQAQYIRRLVDEALAIRLEGSQFESLPGDKILAAIDHILQYDADAPAVDPSAESLCQRMAARLAVRAAASTQLLLEWVRDLVDAPASRIDGARQHAATAIRLLQETNERLLTQAAEKREAAMAIGLAVRAPQDERGERSGLIGWALRRKGPEEQFHQVLTGYATNRLEEALLRAVAKQLRTAEARVATLIEQLDALSRSLNQLAKELQGAAAEDSGPGEGTPGPEATAAARYQQLVLDQLNLRQQEIARNVERVIDQRVLNGDQGLRRYLELESEPRELLRKPLAEVSRRAVLDCVREIIRQLMQLRDAAAPDGGTYPVVDLILAGSDRNRRKSAGADIQRILIVPEGTGLSSLRVQVDRALPNATIAEGRECDVTLCTVTRDASLEQIADEIIAGVDLFKELASRLHTRTDVEWRPIPAVGTGANGPVHDPAALGLATPTVLVAAAAN